MRNVKSIKSVTSVAVAFTFDRIAATKIAVTQIAASPISKSLTAEKRERLIRAIVSKMYRDAYHAARNKRPDVIAKRRQYNKDKWADEKALLATLARRA